MDIKATGLDEAILEAENLVARLRRPKPVMDAIAVDAREFIGDRFESRTAPDGSRWEPVTLATELYRQSDGRGLAKSRFGTSTAKAVRYGAKASFADVHQHGDGRVPARPFAPVEGEGGPSDEFIEEARVRIERFVLTGEV